LEEIGEETEITTSKVVRTIIDRVGGDAVGGGYEILGPVIADIAHPHGVEGIGVDVGTVGRAVEPLVVVVVVGGGREEGRKR